MNFFKIIHVFKIIKILFTTILSRYTLNIYLLNNNLFHVTSWVKQADSTLQFKVEAIVKLLLVAHWVLT